MPDITKVPTADLQAEFLALGIQLEPLANRRAVIDKELRARAKRAGIQARASALNREDRLALKNVL